MSHRKVAFIVGAAHSGSTLLGLVLGSHSRIFHLGELITLPRIINESDQGFFQLCSVCGGECEFWNGQVSSSTLGRYFSRKYSFFSKMARFISRRHRSIYYYFFNWTGCDILVDSSKNDGWVRQQLSPSYHWKKMAPVLIYLTRDGRAAVNSALRKRPGDVEQAARSWRDRIERLNAFYETFPSDRRLIIAYEELATRPSETVLSLCRFLRIGYEPQMLEYWKHRCHPIGGNRGTRSLIFKYHTQLGMNPKSGWNTNLCELGERREYYDQLGLTIKLDLRWKKELSREQLQVFESVAGEINKPFAYPD